VADAIQLGFSSGDRSVRGFPSSGSHPGELKSMHCETGSQLNIFGLHVIV
jgi:hypothetical protein